MAVLLWVLLATAGLGRAAPSNDECLECHAADGPSPLEHVDAFADSAHGVFGCTDCHTDATEVPHAEELKPVALDTCGECHAEAVAAFRQSIHAKLREGDSPAACADCHGDIHAMIAHGQPESGAHWTHLADTCARCHANQEIVEKFRIPVVQPVEAYREGVHGRTVAAGKRAAVCSDCHGAHEILPSTDPRSKIWRGSVADTCAPCHAEVAQEYKESVHGVAVARGVRDAPTCTDCHGEHRILAPSQADSPVFARNLPSQTCGRCHADTRLSAKYGLSVDSVAAFQDSFHGLALRAGQVDVANCASCHGVHGIFHSSDPRSSVSEANVAGTCGKCHPGAGTSFEIGKVHVSATSSPTRIEYWVRIVYLWLIVGVVGFMVLHNAVDLITKARHWPPPAETSPPPPPKVRMSRSLRWQHGLVMLSFPVLVYTGFALTYPEAWWASPMLRWEANLGLRGLVHRVAAVVLVVALLWHAIQLLIDASLRHRLAGLWPGLKDVRVFWGRCLYYAGRRRHPPASGAFSYIEKLEYWAFVWGMVIMTVTGALLWFSDASLRYLPKWFTDVATAIHFYEAVLAALAILVWHLYWVIFDPEVYPMDWSWWTGRAPESRERERAAEDSPAEGGGADERPPGRDDSTR